MRWLVSGDRRWTNAQFLNDALFYCVATNGKPEVVIEGCANGADRLAEQWAKRWGIQLEHYPAEWAIQHKAAGVIRNARMLREGRPDLVIGFHTNLPSSKGTADMIARARKAGVPVWLPWEEPHPPILTGLDTAHAEGVT